MNKKAYLIIIYTITIAVIVIAAGVKFTSWFGGIRPIFSTKISVSTQNTTAEFDVAEFNAIKADLTVAGVEVIVGNKNQVVFEGTEYLVPDVEVKNGVLTIKQPNTVNRIGNNNGKLTIYTTKDTFDYFDVDSDVGDCVLKGLNFKTLDFSVDVGTLELDNITVEGKTDIETNVGEVRIYDSNLNSTVITTDVGEVNIRDTFSADNTFDLKTDIGDINCFGEKGSDHHYSSKGDDIKVDISTDVGEINIR